MSSHFLVMLLLPSFTPCRPTYIFRSVTAKMIIKPDTELLTHHETVIEVRPLDACCRGTPAPLTSSPQTGSERSFRTGKTQTLDSSKGSKAHLNLLWLVPSPVCLLIEPL
ncbi:uncharacterized protein BKA78DRAFT_317041 [Phyllosticta capitalensis]|uniref:uncharacterized protein n=1 Tax=Phyllosticta capitalensis TaxID=121624 RepID=UPI00312DF006